MVFSLTPPHSTGPPAFLLSVSTFLEEFTLTHSLKVAVEKKWKNKGKLVSKLLQPPPTECFPYPLTASLPIFLFIINLSLGVHGKLKP